MRIVDMQRRMVRLGKIRTGEQVASAGGRKRPAKLAHFRITSPSRESIESAAAVYGGTVEPWPDAPGGAQWQVTTTADTLRIVIPPGDQLDQSYELWSGGGCQRRCDGQVNYMTGELCLCPADPAERRDLAAKGKACKVTSRLNVVLPDVIGFGTWLLESHGYYAAVELAGTADFLARVAGDGAAIPARLRLDQREVKRPGQATRQFAVPVIEVGARIRDLMAGTQAPQVGAGATPTSQAAPARSYASVVAPATPAPTAWGDEPELDEPVEPSPSAPSTPASAPEPARCVGFDHALGRCVRDERHPGNHANAAKESWK